MTTSAPISTLSQVLSEFSLCLHPQLGPSCFPGSPQHSLYISQLLSHVAQNMDGLSRGSDKGTEIVHPGQSFRELRSSVGAAGSSPAAEVGRWGWQGQGQRRGRIPASLISCHYFALPDIEMLLSLPLLSFKDAIKALLKCCCFCNSKSTVGKSVP